MTRWNQQLCSLPWLFSQPLFFFFQARQGAQRFIYGSFCLSQLRMNFLIGCFQLLWRWHGCVFGRTSEHSHSEQVCCSAFSLTAERPRSINTHQHSEISFTDRSLCYFWWLWLKIFRNILYLWSSSFDCVSSTWSGLVSCLGCLAAGLLAKTSLSLTLWSNLIRETDEYIIAMDIIKSL